MTGYRRGFKLRATERYFSRQQVAHWQREAQRLKATEQGDQAILYFRRAA